MAALEALARPVSRTVADAALDAHELLSPNYNFSFHRLTWYLLTTQVVYYKYCRLIRVSLSPPLLV